MLPHKNFQPYGTQQFEIQHDLGGPAPEAPTLTWEKLKTFRKHIYGDYFHFQLNHIFALI